jgi:hypothetical protein
MRLLPLSFWWVAAKYSILFAIAKLLVDVHEPAALWFVEVSGLAENIRTARRRLKVYREPVQFVPGFWDQF